MRRAKLAFTLGALAASGGCMRIYPDPELPDIEVTWGEQDCRAGTGDVAVTVTGIDADSTVTSTVPCRDLAVTFADLARERFHVEGALLDTAGAVFVTSDGGDVDLRNGFDQGTGLYFEGFSNFRVAWAFDGGATCESLGANSVGIFFTRSGTPDVEAYQYPCEVLRYSSLIAPATYTVRLRAFAIEQVVAASPETAPFEITETGFVDLGVQTLSACGASCP